MRAVEAGDVSYPVFGGLLLAHWRSAFRCHTHRQGDRDGIGKTRSCSMTTRSRSPSATPTATKSPWMRAALRLSAAAWKSWSAMRRSMWTMARWRWP